MKTSFRLLAVAGLLAGSAAIALAQPAPPPPAGAPGAPCAGCTAGGPGMQGGPGMHHGGGMHRGTGMDPAKMQARMQARMDQLKTALKLTPAQQPAWDALDAKMKTQAEARIKQMGEMQALRGDAQKMLEFRADAMKRNGERLSEVAAARAALVSQLSPEQKTTLEKARTNFAGEYGHGKRQSCGKQG